MATKSAAGYIAVGVLGLLCLGGSCDSEKSSSSFLPPDPSALISSAFVNEVTHELQIVGNIDPPGSNDLITIEPNFGVATNLTPMARWTRGQIVVPNFPAAGPGAGGKVVIRNGSRTGAFEITQWRGKFTYTRFGQGTTKVVYIFDVHLRAVLNFGGFGGQVTNVTVNDGICTYDASGDLDTPERHETWARNGSPDVPYRGGDPSGDRIHEENATIDLQRMRMQIGFNVSVKDGLKVTTFAKQTGQTSTHTELLYDSNGTRDWDVQLGPGYNIRPDGFANFIANYRIDWDAIDSEDPPVLR